MKKKSIARIIVWSIIGALLTLSMVLMLVIAPRHCDLHVTSCKIGDTDLTESIEDLFENTVELVPGVLYVNRSDTDRSGFASGNGVYSEIPEKIKIEWATGRVVIVATDGATDVQLTEYSGSIDPLSAVTETDSIPEKDRMRHKLSNGTLEVEQFKGVTRLIGIHNEYTAKTLLIVLPKTALDTLSIDAALTDIVLIDVTAKTADFDWAMGSLSAKGCAFDRFDADFSAIKGTFENGTIDRLDLDCASGDLTFDLLNAPEKVDLDAAAGNYRFVLPSDAAFSVKKDAVAAGISVTGFENVSVNGNKTVVNGGGKTFDIDMVAGNVTIEAKK